MRPSIQFSLAHSLRVMSSVLILGACNEPSLTTPFYENSSLSASPFRSAAFVLDVSTRNHTVKVSPPTSGVAIGASTQMSMSGLGLNGANASLLGADVIEMKISNYVAGAIGAVIPGKVLVTFDLSLLNRLQGIQLSTPTFPKPPVGVTGVQAFPFELSVLASSGSVTSQGNELLVASPSFGAVIASNDWDGQPHSFFNDTACNPGSTDCFRYEPFGAIGSAGSSVPRKVGFLLDPTVREFRIRLLVAADITPVAR